jgi:copper(I)-binding protein
MTHAGMQPVLRTIESGEDGLYQTDFEWTMAGDWIVTINATLADGTVISEDFEYTLAGDEMNMSDEDMSDMDHDMGEMDMSGSVTGGYMQLTNEGEEADTLVGVAADFADTVEIHETRIEDDMASMVEIGSIEIPAGETASLEPGGMHIMFMGLTRDLMPGDTVELTLTFESGAETTVVAIVQDEAPEAGEAATAGDIVIGGAWVRPALAGDASSEGDMSDMDMSEDVAEDDMSDMDMSEEGTDEEMDMDATPTTESEF